MERDPVRMERLWAPWRLAYVAASEQPVGRGAGTPGSKRLDFLPGADRTCFLCCYAADSADRDNLVIDRGRQVLTVLNRYPYNNGHLLIAPLVHVAQLDQLAADQQLEMMRTISRMTRVLERIMHPEGFNVGLNLGQVAGAGLPGHLHWHVVPRWNGDTNFMSTLADTRVIPQSLESAWELLSEALSGSA